MPDRMDELARRLRLEHAHTASLVRSADGHRSFGAYVPDLPGCVAVGGSRAEVLVRIREAIALHVAAMREDGHSPPVPTSTVAVVEVAA